ncbi:uncharacterized protein BO96DRAFT_436969 [Aspergillus niger CBS 101883]|uniref:uncharacterized protein n=1 Tax=Aspergillus lacticoffeatus (strain CBS 101883) TaxID=1450533 RepID=UPI000D7F8258|nr:uncharacterized protein BO96DRAFT_436969 [Aspergillus niger CBS 101883]PYH53678.1 hypothetical protein BO96DRAFT_436969 [Aspergillus niger CBS 101883]
MSERRSFPAATRQKHNWLSASRNARGLPSCLFRANGGQIFEDPLERRRYYTTEGEASVLRSERWEADIGGLATFPNICPRVKALSSGRAEESKNVAQSFSIVVAHLATLVGGVHGDKTKLSLSNHPK